MSKSQTNKKSIEEEVPTGSQDLDKRRATVPHILKPQQSFEKRYSKMINRQILETSINRRVLQRQVNVFFGFPASPTKTSPEEEDDAKQLAKLTQESEEIETTNSSTELVPKEDM